jgi:small conductance mechanosensitive channel
LCAVGRHRRDQGGVSGPGGRGHTLADRTLEELRSDSRIDDHSQPAVTVTKVLDVANPATPILELTVSAKAKPSQADAVKQCVLDRASALLAAA